MDKQETRVLQALGRADHWLDENGVSISAATNLGEQHQALKASIARAKQYANQQDPRLAPNVVTRADQEVLRDHIVVELRDVAKLARRLRNTIPGIGALVAPSNRLGAIKFVRSAESFMSKATIYSQVLIEYGMSPDFVTSIQAELKQLEGIFTARGTARSDVVSATVSLNHELKGGLAIVDFADVIISRALRNSDPGKLAGWRATKRPSAAQSPRGQPVTTTTPTTQAA